MVGANVHVSVHVPQTTLVTVVVWAPVALTVLQPCMFPP